MEVSEVRRLKKEFEEDIDCFLRKRLVRFSQESGMDVRSIHIPFYDVKSMGGGKYFIIAGSECDLHWGSS